MDKEIPNWLINEIDKIRQNAQNILPDAINRYLISACYEKMTYESHDVCNKGGLLKDDFSKFLDDKLAWIEWCNQIRIGSGYHALNSKARRDYRKTKEFINFISFVLIEFYKRIRTNMSKEIDFTLERLLERHLYWNIVLEKNPKLLKQFKNAKGADMRLLMDEINRRARILCEKDRQDGLKFKTKGALKIHLPKKLSEKEWNRRYSSCGHSTEK